MVFHKSGTYKVYLVILIHSQPAKPIISFKVKINIDSSKPISVPQYLGEGDQEIVQLPKNGILPKNKWVRFRVKSGGSRPRFIRVFAQYFIKENGLIMKIELFEVKGKNLAQLNDTYKQGSFRELPEEDEEVTYFERHI